MAFDDTGANAGTITYTGAELRAEPSASFPTTQPTQNGSSIEFGPGSSFEKLLVLPLFPAGTFPTSGPATFTISVNVARQIVDTDLFFLIGSGDVNSGDSLMVGAVAADNNGGQFLGTSLVDAGNTGTSRELTSVFTNAGYPAIGQSFDVDLI